ncbi:hypothetical protein EVAR_63718_1 [Eumeta japonica]|uniref:Uncharacterized protein n=1 Tax=Eumeta variegata TaxID=151549 RepID=A0A4C1ZYG6_EUMVA|nr:hypothetical protein EVAR_63718_1 [Eumeta japonica]
MAPLDPRPRILVYNFAFAVAVALLEDRRMSQITINANTTDLHVLVTVHPRRGPLRARTCPHVGERVYLTTTRTWRHLTYSSPIITHTLSNYKDRYSQTGSMATTKLHGPVWHVRGRRTSRSSFLKLVPVAAFTELRTHPAAARAWRRRRGPAAAAHDTFIGSETRRSSLSLSL